MADHFTIIRNGRLVDLHRREIAPADILIEGDRILSIGHAGMDAPPDARVIDASDRAMMSGLVNAHVHGHGNPAKRMVGDRWLLELFLNAMPGMTGPSHPCISTDWRRLNRPAGLLSLTPK
jgi:guanine deaminase